MNALATIGAVDRQTLGAQVTDRLRELVVVGEFAPGTRLREVDLAEGFAVSRGPVREALQHLVQEGLLRRDPRHGIFVPTITDGDIADMYFVRTVIEGAALRVVIARDPRPLAAVLAATAREMGEAAAADDWHRVAELDIAFHAALVAAADSARLSRAYAAIMDEVRLCLNLTAHHPGKERLTGEHEVLAVHLEAGDIAAVVRALDDHMATAIAALQHRRAADASVRPGARPMTNGMRTDP